MIPYLINMTSCALLLYVIYALLFEKENLHRFKRIYLLASLVFSMLIPFIVLKIDIPQIPANIGGFYAGLHDKFISPENLLFETEVSTQLSKVTTAPLVNYSLWITVAYATITMLFLFRFLKNCLRMLAFSRKNGYKDYNGARIVLVKDKLVPHSFGRYIFINSEDYNSGLVPDEIMIHELTHVRQRHTFDILFIELLISFGWFNPVFYLYRNKIKQNHEYLADDAVVGTNKALVPDYFAILLNQIPQNKKISNCQ